MRIRSFRRAGLVSPFTPASESRLKDPPAAQLTAVGLGVSKALGDFPALPAVVDELRDLIRDRETFGRSAGIVPGRVLLDDAFTESTMKGALRQQYPIVHIASHFQFHPGNELDSFLLLGDGQHLTLADLKRAPNLFTGVELLTLSACDTATGSPAANGAEVEGFAVVAQRQGAKAVVATLWPVADTSTQRLMREFYGRRIARHVSKAEAMRTNRNRGSKRRLRRIREPLDTFWAHPGWRSRRYGGRRTRRVRKMVDGRRLELPTSPLRTTSVLRRIRLSRRKVSVRVHGSRSDARDRGFPRVSALSCTSVVHAVSTNGSP